MPIVQTVLVGEKRRSAAWTWPTIRGSRYAAVTLLLLWPSGSTPSTAGAAYQDVTFTSGTIGSVVQKECAATTEDRLPDGSVPAKAICVTATVTVDGKDINVNVPAQVSRAGLSSGDRVRLILYPAQDGEPAAALLLGVGLAGLLVVSRTRPPRRGA